MIEWLDDFYGSDTTRAAVSASIAPVFEKYAAEVWKADGGTGKPPADFVESLSDTYVKHHLDSSRAQLQEVLKADDPKAAIQSRITEWIEKRPGKVAANETVRISNAMAVAQMRAQGVTRKVWRTVGTCAFCKEMSGKTTTIEKDFVKPGDSLHPEGVEVAMTITQPVGHPPLHQGCRCSIEAETTEQQTVLGKLASDVEASSAQGSARTRELARQAGLSAQEADALENMARGWNIDGMSFDGMALREAALKRGATAGDFVTHPQRRQFISSRFAADRLPQADRLLDISQEAVRRELGTTGTVRVYRGVTYDAPLANGPGAGATVEMALEQRPLASWSLSRQEAVNFATDKEFGVGYVLEMDVPISDVAGMAGTGLGNGVHSEVVLFGRANHVARVSQP